MISFLFIYFLIKGQTLPYLIKIMFKKHLVNSSKPSLYTSLKCKQCFNLLVSLFINAIVFIKSVCFIIVDLSIYNSSIRNLFPVLLPPTPQHETTHPPLHNPPLNSYWGDYFAIRATRLSILCVQLNCLSPGFCCLKT